MFKWIPIIACIPAIMWTYAFVFMACSPSDPPKPVPIVEETKVIPERYEILYDRDTGQCNVITRSAHGLVSESLFSSDSVDDCYKYTLDNPKGE